MSYDQARCQVHAITIVDEVQNMAPVAVYVAHHEIHVQPVYPVDHNGLVHGRWKVGLFDFYDTCIPNGNLYRICIAILIKQAN